MPFQVVEEGMSLIVHPFLLPFSLSSFQVPEGQCPTCRSHNLTQSADAIHPLKNFALENIVEHYIVTLKDNGHPSWQENGDLFLERVFRCR
jgi:hypothetical protein